jgi:hypothetical protein
MLVQRLGQRRFGLGRNVRVNQSGAATACGFGTKSLACPYRVFGHASTDKSTTTSLTTVRLQEAGLSFNCNEALYNINEC